MSDIFSNIESLHQSLNYHLMRHSLLASNIANAETPGYKPLDLSFKNFLSKAEEIDLTDPNHLGGTTENRSSMAIFTDATGTPGNDGNAVSVEREMSKITANSIRYRAAAEMLSRRLGLIKYAASDGQRR